MSSKTRQPSTPVMPHSNGTAPAPPDGGSPPAQGDDDIEITFKRTAHKIEIDMDQITWADELRAKRFRDQAQNGGVDEAEAEAFLNDLIHKVTGRDPLTMPRTVVERVTLAIFGEQKRAAATEGNSGTGS